MRVAPKMDVLSAAVAITDGPSSAAASHSLLKPTGAASVQDSASVAGAASAGGAVPAAGAAGDGPGGACATVPTLKRVGSVQLVCLNTLPAGYSVDTSKSSGFRVDTGWREAALYALAPGHNEFWNCLTDVLPLLYFALAGVELARRPAFASTPPELRAAIVLTVVGTCVQHGCSLVSHMFTSVSARMSHAIWFVDYAGIALNFVWNAPAMALVWRYAAFAPWWPSWLALNVVLSVGTLGGGVWLAFTHQPALTTPTAGESWTTTFFSQGLASVLLVGVLLAPNLLLTLLCGAFADRSALGVIFGLPVAIAFKELHWPERWLGRGTERFDNSLWHSHVLWHMFVYARRAAAYARGAASASAEGHERGELTSHSPACGRARALSPTDSCLAPPAVLPSRPPWWFPSRSPCSWFLQFCYLCCYRNLVSDPACAFPPP